MIKKTYVLILDIDNTLKYMKRFFNLSLIQMMKKII